MLGDTRLGVIYIPCGRYSVMSNHNPEAKHVFTLLNILRYQCQHGVLLNHDNLFHSWSNPEITTDMLQVSYKLHTHTVYRVHLTRNET